MPCKGIPWRCPPKGVSGTGDCSIPIRQLLCKGTPLCGSPKRRVVTRTPAHLTSACTCVCLATGGAGTGGGKGFALKEQRTEIRRQKADNLTSDF
jgi:hypothetical protein